MNTLSDVLRSVRHVFVTITELFLVAAGVFFVMGMWQVFINEDDAGMFKISMKLGASALAIIAALFVVCLIANRIKRQVGKLDRQE